MSTRAIGLIGASGFGSEVLPLLEKQIKNSDDLNQKIFIIDSDNSKSTLFERKVISEEEFLKINVKEKSFNIAVSDPQIRRKIYDRLSAYCLSPIAIFADDYRHIRDVSFGKGAIILPNVLFTSNIKIGNFFHCNPKCSIAHDCNIGDFVTLAPGALINGNVSIDDNAYIGAGAVIKQGLNIGKNSIIGMGSIVLEDVPENTTVVGNPAREIN